MNSKMTNSQLATTEPKKMKTKTKQTTRTGTESEKWTTWRVFSGEEWWGGRRYREKSIIGRHKIDRGRLRIV